MQYLTYVLSVLWTDIDLGDKSHIIYFLTVIWIVLKAQFLNKYQFLCNFFIFQFKTHDAIPEKKQVINQM